MMVGVLLLMMWSSYVRAATSHEEIDRLQYPQCSFNPLCTCSKPAPDLGIMQCRNVPFPAIPNIVNVSKVFTLHMENTGLRELEPFFFQATGECRLACGLVENHRLNVAMFAAKVCTDWRLHRICSPTFPTTRSSAWSDRCGS